MDKKRNALNGLVVNTVAEELRVTRQFVRQAIRGDRTSTTAEEAVKKYNQKLEVAKKALASK